MKRARFHKMRVIEILQESCNFSGCGDVGGGCFGLVFRNACCFGFFLVVGFEGFDGFWSWVLTAVFRLFCF